MPRAVLAALLLWAVSFGPTSRCLAHDPGLSALEVELDPARVRVRVTLALPDAALLAKSDLESPELLERLREAVRAGTRVEIDGAIAAVTSASAARDESGDAGVELMIPGIARSSVRVRADYLSALPAEHRQYAARVESDGRRVGGRLLDATANMLEFDASDSAAAADDPEAVGFRAFFALGIEHILLGFDHLLFLFSLLVAGLSLRRAFGIITAFTVAHSITLALSAFDLVRLPGAIVEPVIAASIVYVAIENLMGRGDRASRWMLTFAFGLVHGLGFAEVLRELGIDRIDAPLVPLVAFNVGVEMGQLAIAALVLPLLFALQRWPSVYPRFAFAASSVVLLLGGWWLVERTLLA